MPDLDIGIRDSPWFAGDSGIIDLTILESDGTAKDLTGATVKWAMSVADGDKPAGPALVTKSTEDGGVIVTNALQGTIRIVLNTGDTNGLDGKYYHEVEVTDATDKSTSWGGNFVLRPQLITNS